MKPLTGSLEVVTKDGVPMLRASSVSEFLITLPQVLPPAFTIEFALISKQCCNPEDLGFEGTATMNRGTASAAVLWSRERVAVIGGGEIYQAAMPAALAGTLPGQLSTVVVTFDDTEVKLYTNGQRLFTLADRRFMRGQVLRVFLGGQDEGDQAVYLAGLRISAGATAPMVLARQQSAATGSLTSAGSTVRPAGTGTIATTAPVATPTAAPPASAGAVSQGAVVTAQGSGRTSGALKGTSNTTTSPGRCVHAGPNRHSPGLRRNRYLRRSPAARHQPLRLCRGRDLRRPRPQDSYPWRLFGHRHVCGSLSPQCRPPRVHRCWDLRGAGSEDCSPLRFHRDRYVPDARSAHDRGRGFSATGLFTTLAPRTVALSGWTAVGVNP